MSTTAEVASGPGPARVPRLLSVISYLRRNPIMISGLVILLGLALFVILGHLFYDITTVEALSVPANQRPNSEYPFGTDRQGRDIFAVIIVGTPLTLRIGLIAGTLGVFVGMILGFFSAYSGGWVDSFIKTFVDILLTGLTESSTPGRGVVVRLRDALMRGAHASNGGRNYRLEVFRKTQRAILAFCAGEELKVLLTPPKDLYELPEDPGRYLYDR